MVNVLSEQMELYEEYVDSVLRLWYDRKDALDEKTAMIMIEGMRDMRDSILCLALKGLDEDSTPAGSEAASKIRASFDRIMEKCNYLNGIVKNNIERDNNGDYHYIKPII